MKGQSPSFRLRRRPRLGGRVEAHFVDVGVVGEQVAVSLVELAVIGMTKPAKHEIALCAPHQEVRGERVAHAMRRDPLHPCGDGLLNDSIPYLLRVVPIDPLGPGLRFLVHGVRAQDVVSRFPMKRA